MSYGDNNVSSSQANALLNFQQNIQNQQGIPRDTYQPPPQSNGGVRQDYKGPDNYRDGLSTNTPQARNSRMTSFLKGGAKALKVPACVVGYALALPAAAVSAVVVGIPLAIANKVTAKPPKEINGARMAQERNLAAKFVRKMDSHESQVNTATIISSGARMGAFIALCPNDVLNTYIKKHGG